MGHNHTSDPGHRNLKKKVKEEKLHSKHFLLLRFCSFKKFGGFSCLLNSVVHDNTVLPRQIWQVMIFLMTLLYSALPGEGRTIIWARAVLLS